MMIINSQNHPSTNPTYYQTITRHGHYHQSLNNKHHRLQCLQHLQRLQCAYNAQHI